MKFTNLKKKRLNMRTKKLSQISRNLLRSHGIEGIILDLDNTIVSEDDVYLSPDAETWIQEARQEGMRFFMLSNGKRKYRVNYWSSRLMIPAISPARKPFPFSFRKALKEMKLPPHRVVVIGDSFHTDILGAYCVGCSYVQVASLPHPPRWWERFVGHWIQSPYQDIHELWLFDSHCS
jgi:HAD superfamily phosphatase (TIGR01668 family)